MVEYNRYAVDNVDSNGRTPLMYATIKNKVCFKLDTGSLLSISNP